MSPRTLTDSHKRAMQAGRARAAKEKRESLPERIAAVEAAMDDLAVAYRERKALGDFDGMARVRADLRRLSDQRFSLRYGESAA